MNLDLPSAEFDAALARACDVLRGIYGSGEPARVFPLQPASELRAQFEETLPLDPVPLTHLIDQFEQQILPASVATWHPRFLAYLMAGANQAGVIGDWLGTALNQNAAKFQTGPAATILERLVVTWIAQFIGFSADAGGTIVSGGTVANLTALATLRHVYFPGWEREGAPRNARPTLYVSTEGHASIERSVALLGFGSRYLRRVPVRSDFTLDIGALRLMLSADRARGFRPICVIGNAGTTNTGAVDPLQELADLCQEHELWFHVDGAYGAPAAETSRARATLRGMDRADSIALDPHKWLFVPFDAGCCLVRDPKLLRATFAVVQAAYVASDRDQKSRDDLMHDGFELSRGMRALKIWMTFKAHGANRLRQAIEDSMVVMTRLGNLVEESEDFELLAPVMLSVVCFRYRPAGLLEARLDGLNRALLDAVERDGRTLITGTILNGCVALRAGCVNHRTEERHVEDILKILRELAVQVHE